LTIHSTIRRLSRIFRLSDTTHVSVYLELLSIPETFSLNLDNYANLRRMSWLLLWVNHARGALAEHVLLASSIVAGNSCAKMPTVCCGLESRDSWSEDEFM
jgi:hypothetical protein